MKLTKGIKYYFWTWIIVLPLTFIINLSLSGNTESFLVLIGIGALVQLVFLSIRYLFLKVKDMLFTPYYNASCGDFPKTTE